MAKKKSTPRKRRAMREWLKRVEENPEGAFESVKPVVEAAVFDVEGEGRPWWRRAARVAGHMTRNSLISAAAKAVRERIP